MQCVIKDFKVDVLPTKGEPNSRYYVPNGNGTDIDEYVTDKKGSYHKVNPLLSIPTIPSNEINEILIGTVNNSNATFTTTFPFKPESTLVFVNGLLQKKPLHYNTVGNQTVVFTDSPQTGDFLEINYKL